MKKSQRPKVKKSKPVKVRDRHLRPNPVKAMAIPPEWLDPVQGPNQPHLSSNIGGISDMLSNSAGNMAITNSLRGCTLHEKLLIAAILPSFVSVIRTAKPKASVDELVDKLYVNKAKE